MGRWLDGTGPAFWPSSAPQGATPLKAGTSLLIRFGDPRGRPESTLAVAGAGVST